MVFVIVLATRTSGPGVVPTVRRVNRLRKDMGHGRCMADQIESETMTVRKRTKRERHYLNMISVCRHPLPRSKCTHAGTHSSSCRRVAGTDTRVHNLQFHSLGFCNVQLSSQKQRRRWCSWLGMCRIRSWNQSCHPKRRGSLTLQTIHRWRRGGGGWEGVREGIVMPHHHSQLQTARPERGIMPKTTNLMLCVCARVCVCVRASTAPCTYVCRDEGRKGR